MYPTETPTGVEQEVADKIEGFVNAHGLRPEGLISAMSLFHRTLQQHFTRICVAWIEYLSKLDEGQFDLRNQHSVEFAKALVKTEVWEKRFLPYV